MQKSIRRLIALTIAMVFASLFGTASFAAVIAATGGPLIRVDTRSNTDPTQTNSISFINLAGAQIRIIIPPAGGSRLVVARFSAESLCSGNGARCLLQIIAFNADTSVTTEMHPQTVDFAFDSVSTPVGENDNFVRLFTRAVASAESRHLSHLQFAVTAVNNLFTLDDWHLTVSQYD